MTQNGWCEVGDMKVGETKIGILCEPMEMSHGVKKVECVLTVKDFLKTTKDCGLPKDLINLHLSILDGNQLVPLFNDDGRLPILARICGFILTDGSISVHHKKDRKGNRISIKGDFGTELDANIFEDDIEELGFGRTKVQERNTIIHGFNHHTWTVSPL